MDKIIIFDMDGTLINSSVDITASINFVRNHKSMPPLSVNEVAGALNSDRNDLALKFYGTADYLADDRALFENHYIDECIKTSHLYDGIPESLQALSQMGFSMSVATNAPTKYAVKMITHLRIDQYFDHIIGACKVDTPKPHPEMLNMILNKYQYQSSDTVKPVMIGDSQTDMSAGKNANMLTVFVDWGFGQSDTKEDMRLSSPYELENLQYFYKHQTT